MKTKKLWLTVSWDNSPTTFQWMVEMDLNKPYKFVELSNGRIGFTQLLSTEDKKVKKFISQALRRERKRAVKLVEKTKLPYPNPCGEYVQIKRLNEVILGGLKYKLKGEE